MEKEQRLRRTVRHSSQRSRKRKKSRIGSFLGLLVFILMIGTITAFGYTYFKIEAALHKVSESSSGKKANAEAENGDTPPSIIMGEGDQERSVYAVAIIGTDHRSQSIGTMNADVLMVALVDKETQDVHLLSIPRDTKIQIPGYSGYRKANAAFALGEHERRQQERKNEEVTTSGSILVKQMLSDYLQIPIDYHVQVGFQGFEEVVDLIGGVQVHVKRSMIYDSNDGTHIRLSPGVQLLNGKHALDYVRFRLDNRGPSYYSSDFERNERQQEVIRAIVDKLTSFGGVTRIYSIIDALSSAISTNFTVDQMKELIWTFKSVSSNQMHTIPNDAYWDSQQAFTIIPEASIIEIRNTLSSIMNQTNR